MTPAPKRRWLLIYEVSPLPQHSGQAKAKRVSCWVTAESLEGAAEIAVRDLAAWHWSIACQVEAKAADDKKPSHREPTNQLAHEEVGSKLYCFDD